MSENGIKNTNKKKTVLIILCAVVGVFLLLFGSFGKSSDPSGEEENRIPSDLDPSAYADRIEEQVVELCSRVKGVGTVSAVVTLEGGYRAVYATDSQSNASGYKNSMVLVGSGSSEEAVLICYENPEIAGIGIVCSGSISDEVKSQIISLVAATFRIGSNRIYVVTSS